MGRGLPFWLIWGVGSRSDSKVGAARPPRSNSSASAPRPVAGTPRPREEQITWRGRRATRVFTRMLALRPLVETKNL